MLILLWRNLFKKIRLTGIRWRMVENRLRRLLLLIRRLVHCGRRLLIRTIGLVIVIRRKLISFRVAVV